MKFIICNGNKFLSKNGKFETDLTKAKEFKIGEALKTCNSFNGEFILTKEK